MRQQAARMEKMWDFVQLVFKSYHTMVKAFQTANEWFFLTHYLHQCSTHIQEKVHHGRARETNFCTVNSLSRKKNLTSNIKRERFASLLCRRASACQGAAKMWKAMAIWKELAGWVLLQTQTCCSFWKANKITKLNRSWNKIVMRECWHLKIVTCVRLQEESCAWK